MTTSKPKKYSIFTPEDNRQVMGQIFDTSEEAFEYLKSKRPDWIDISGREPALMKEETGDILCVLEVAE